MSKRRLRNAGNRPKAFFGESMAAAIAGATVGGMFQLAATESANRTAKENARNEAKTILQNAKDQAQAIKDQTAKTKEYQEMAQEFTKEQNAENRDIQKDSQMIIQMAMGQQNVNDRLEASKIKVKAGGKTKKLGYTQSLLRGGNMPFKVTDGGGVVPVGLTPEGFELYEIVGNDHEHYHKAQGGKYKSGVGIKFANGEVVEGEGDQRQRAKNGGEFMLVTPNDAFFISKHNIGGINPKNLVEQGMHPLQAFAIQENQKDIIGINDNGSRKAKKGRRLLRFMIGGTPDIYDMDNWEGPKVGMNTTGDMSLNIPAIEIGKRSLKYGGKIRHKAVDGTWITDSRGYRRFVPSTTGSKTISSGPGNGGRNSFYGQTTGGNASSTTTPRSSNGGPGTGGRTGVGIYGGGGNNPGQMPNVKRVGPSSNTSGNFSGWLNRNADIIGTGISGAFNVLGAALSASNARDTANIVADAQRTGAGYMRDAYNSLRTIDMNNLRREDYAAAHMMPALQAPVSFAENQVAGVNRSLQRRLRNAGRYSMSSAAAQERMANAEVEAQDQRNRVYSADQQQMQQIRQANAERVSEASKINAMLDTQANERYGQDYLRLLQYNNDIENTKILGSAGSTTEGLINSANTIAQGRNAASQSWVNALSNIGLTASNTLSTMAKRRADLENVMLGSTMSGQVNYLSRFGSKADKNRQKAAIQQALKTENLSPEDKATYEYYLRLLS